MEAQGIPVSSHSPASTETENLLSETPALGNKMEREQGHNPEENGAAGNIGSGETVGVVEMKRKRGRPRKYDVVDGGAVVGHVLQSSTPVSMVSFSSSSSSSSLTKRGRGRPRGSGKLQLLASLGGLAVDTAGGSFTPHVITVKTGEDVVSKIMFFSESGSRAVCILSATGSVSNVTLRQPSGGYLKYEGLFEILTLSGSCVFTSTSGSQQRKNGMISVSLATPDGRVFGGVVGSMIAVLPIQLIVGSFKQDISHQLRRLSGESAMAASVLSSPNLVRVPVQMARTDVDGSTLTPPLPESTHGGTGNPSIAANQHMNRASLFNVGQNAFQAMPDQKPSLDNNSSYVRL